MNPAQLVELLAVAKPYIIMALVVAVFPLVVAWGASRYPARRAANVDPVDALRAD